jgi:hypothetical protein
MLRTAQNAPTAHNPARGPAPSVDQPVAEASLLAQNPEPVVPLAIVVPARDRLAGPVVSPAVGPPVASGARPSYAHPYGRHAVAVPVVPNSSILTACSCCLPLHPGCTDYATI